MQKNDVLRRLFEAAEKASLNSYSPYSEFPVGAAVMTDDGSVFTGANIENRSFGLTNCAERSAVFAAVSSGYRRITAVAVAAPKADYPVAPCGACRQVLSEFGGADVPVLFGNSFGNAELHALSELYPFDSLHELAGGGR